MTIVIETKIDGVLRLAPVAARDERGWFLRVFDGETYAGVGIDPTVWVQENQSRSRARTIRGLHTRSSLTEAKLVRVAHGAIFDVVVDLRPWSPTFLAWERFILDDEVHEQIYVPAGCAHGFQALSSRADVCYRVDAVYDPTLDVGLRWSDPELGILWPLADPVVSARDRSAPLLNEIRDQLATWFGDRLPIPD